MPTKKAPRNVCFTLNNPTPEERQHLCIKVDLDDKNCRVRYIVFGTEYGGKEGTLHLQGYIELNTVLTMSQLKTLIGHRAHLEARKGSPKQAAGYCKKGSDTNDDNEVFFPRTMAEPETWEDPYESGTISTQGKRTDLTAPVEMLTAGHTIREAAREFPEQHVKYHKGFRDLRALLLNPRSLAALPEVIVLWGPTGTGKTRDASLKYWPDEPHYVWKPSNGNWWDGYDGEKEIIIDEFRAQMTWSDILGLLDRNQYRAPVKGGFVDIQADKFVITSPFPPHMWYKDDARYDRFKQLERRITKVIDYTPPPREILNANPYSLDTYYEFET